MNKKGSVGAANDPHPTKGPMAASQSIRFWANMVAVQASFLAVMLSVGSLVQELHELGIEDDEFDLGDLGNILSASGTIINSSSWLVLFFAQPADGAAAAILSSLSVTGGVLMLLGVALFVGYEIYTSLPGSAEYIQACIDHFEESEAGKALLGPGGDPDFAESFEVCKSFMEENGSDIYSLKGDVGCVWDDGHRKWILSNIGPKMAEVVFEVDSSWVKRNLVRPKEK